MISVKLNIIAKDPPYFTFTIICLHKLWISISRNILLLNRHTTLTQQHLSRNVRKCTFWHVRVTKAQITIRIFEFWSVLVFRMKKLWLTWLTKVQVTIRILAVWSESLFSACRTLHPCLTKMRTVNILIRLRESAGWPESSLGYTFPKFPFLIFAAHFNLAYQLFSWCPENGCTSWLWLLLGYMFGQRFCSVFTLKIATAKCW